MALVEVSCLEGMKERKLERDEIEIREMMMRLEGEKGSLLAGMEEQQRQAAVELGAIILCCDKREKKLEMRIAELEGKLGMIEGEYETEMTEGRLEVARLRGEIQRLEAVYQRERVRAEEYKQQAVQLDVRKQQYKQHVKQQEQQLQGYQPKLTALNEANAVLSREAEEYKHKLAELREDNAVLRREAESQYQRKLRDAYEREVVQRQQADDNDRLCQDIERLRQDNERLRQDNERLCQQLVDQVRVAAAAPTDQTQLGDQAALTQAAVHLALREHRIDIFKWTVKVVPGPDGKPRVEYIATFAPQVLPVAAIAQCEKKVGLEKDLAARCAELFFDGLVRDEDMDEPVRFTRPQLLVFIKTTCAECGIPVDEVIRLADTLIKKKLKQNQRQEDEDAAFDVGLTLEELHALDEEEDETDDRDAVRCELRDLEITKSRHERKRALEPDEAAPALETDGLSLGGKAVGKATSGKRPCKRKGAPALEIVDFFLGGKAGGQAKSGKRPCKRNAKQPVFSACSDHTFDDDL